MTGFPLQQFQFCCLTSIVLTAAFLTGCQQPVGSQSARPALFDLSRSPRLFGNSRFANRDNGPNNPYAAQIPDLQIQDGVNSINTQVGQQLQNLNNRVGASDADNQLLNTQVSSLKQKLQLANQYNQTLKDQLAGTSNQIQRAVAQRNASTQQLARLQQQLNQAQQNLQQNQRPSHLVASTGAAPTHLAGTATLRANNSLLGQLASIKIPGGSARMDGDVIRIEFPSDILFVRGTYQIQPAQQPLLQNIARTIRNSFSRQIIGIEAHWDNTPLNPPGTTHHQLTATQALSVFDHLVRLGLPEKQIFTMAMASNRPRHRQANIGQISPNRRIELVIYPETYDGS